MNLPKINFNLNINKEMLIGIAGVALGGVALVLAITTKSTVNNVSASIDFDKSVNVEIAASESDESVVTEDETADAEGTEGEEETSEEYAEEEAEEEVSASFNIISRNGSLKVSNSTLRLNAAEDDPSDYIYVYLDGENFVRYNTDNGYIIVNESIIVQSISASDASYNGISEFTNSDGEIVLIGEREVNDYTGIAVVYTLDASVSEASEDDIILIQDILNNASSQTEIETFTLFGVEANVDWMETIIMTTEALQLTKGETSIYCSPYTGSFAEGTTNTLTVGDVTLTYCESAQDTSTGYVPYIYEFTEDQNGYCVDGDDDVSLKVKYLATKNGIIKGLFS